MTAGDALVAHVAASRIIAFSISASTLAIGAGLDVRAAMAFSAATAAMKCRHAGGRNGIPEINECLVFMRTKP